ncbi:MAG: hypothetical protein ABIU09_09065 [Pyrinomonadaceae bacterium]
MKRCPECRRDYYDDTLSFCLDDGKPLLEGPAIGSTSMDEPATAILHSTAAPGDARTGAQIHTTEQTAVGLGLNRETGELSGKPSRFGVFGFQSWLIQLRLINRLEISPCCSRRVDDRSNRPRQ